MVVYFLTAPDLYAAIFAHHGKPLRMQGIKYKESDRISWVVEDLALTSVDGQGLFNLYGWAFIAPTGDGMTVEYTREIVLISEKRRYIFPVQSVFRNPSPQNLFREMNVDLNKLGFSAFIEENFIEPGKYRIGILFKDHSNDIVYYWDKPVYYLIRTPNLLRLEEN